MDLDTASLLGFAESSGVVPPGLQRQIYVTEKTARRPLASIALAARCDLSPELAADIARDSRVKIRVAWVTRPEHDAQTLDLFAAKESRVTVLAAIASHANISQPLLSRLAAGTPFSVRFAAVSNPACDPQHVIEMVLDQELDHNQRGEVITLISSRPALAGALAARQSADYTSLVSPDLWPGHRVTLDDALFESSHIDPELCPEVVLRLFAPAFAAVRAGEQPSRHPYISRTRILSRRAQKEPAARRVIDTLDEMSSVEPYASSSFRKILEQSLGIKLAPPVLSVDELCDAAAVAYENKDRAAAREFLSYELLDRYWVLRLLEVSSPQHVVSGIVERFHHDDEVMLAAIAPNMTMLYTEPLSKLFADPLAAITALLTHASVPSQVLTAVLKDPMVESSWICALPWQNCRTLKGAHLATLLATLTERLGDTGPTWEVFMSLSPTFVGTVGDLTDACLASAR